MKTRLAAAAALTSAAALTLALAPATASTSTTTETDSFSSSTGLSPRAGSVPESRLQLPTSLPSTSQAQRRATAQDVAAADPITAYSVRGYQTLYKAGTDNSLAGDVTVTRDPSEYCFILSNMNVNGTDRDEPAQTFPGVSYPEGDEDFGGPNLPHVYGAASYRFGPHYFYGPGADGSCFTADDAPDGVVSEKLSNTVRVRYQSKGSVQYKKVGSKVKVHVLSQRFDRSGKYVGQRSIKLQYRKAGTTTWSTKKTMSLDATGRGDYNFTSKAKYYYRVYVPLTDNVQSAFSPQQYL